jgi:hypothetical protein
VAKTEGDAPIPDDLRLSEIDFAAAESTGEPAAEPLAEAAAEPAEEPLPEAAAESPDEPLAEAAAETELLSETAEEETAETEEEESTEEEEEKKPKLAAFLENLKEANPYTVMLGVALALLVIAVFCLLIEWGSYGLFRVKPNIGKPGAYQPVQSGPPTTIAAAWPMGAQLSSIAVADEGRSGSPWTI